MSTGLTSEQIVSFVRDGFVRVERAFPRELADQGRSLLWAEMGLSPKDPSGWTEAVIRLPGSAADPFKRAATSEQLLLAFDQLVGARRWVKPAGLGTFPIRFPNLPEPNDTGWHCDGSFGEMPYHLNLRSRGRALLMLYLLSDVGEEDAPTRIRVGSHLDPQTGYTVYYVAELTDITPRIVALISEILHTLRTALDNLAYQLFLACRANPGDEGEGIYFPIYDDGKTKETDAFRKITPFRQEIVEAMRKVNPSKSGQPLLWVLHRLDIVNKHRRILVEVLVNHSVFVRESMRQMLIEQGYAPFQGVQ